MPTAGASDDGMEFAPMVPKRTRRVLPVECAVSGPAGAACTDAIEGLDFEPVVPARTATRVPTGALPGGPVDGCPLEEAMSCGQVFEPVVPKRCSGARPGMPGCALTPAPELSGPRTSLPDDALSGSTRAVATNEALGAMRRAASVSSAGTRGRGALAPEEDAWLDDALSPTPTPVTAFLESQAPALTACQASATGSHAVGAMGGFVLSGSHRSHASAVAAAPGMGVCDHASVSSTSSVPTALLGAPHPAGQWHPAASTVTRLAPDDVVALVVKPTMPLGAPADGRGLCGASPVPLCDSLSVGSPRMPRDPTSAFHESPAAEGAARAGARPASSRSAPSATATTASEGAPKAAGPRKSSAGSPAETVETVPPVGGRALHIGPFDALLPSSEWLPLGRVVIPPGSPGIAARVVWHDQGGPGQRKGRIWVHGTPSLFPAAPALPAEQWVALDLDTRPAKAHGRQQQDSAGLGASGRASPLLQSPGSPLPAVPSLGSTPYQSSSTIKQTSGPAGRTSGSFEPPAVSHPQRATATTTPGPGSVSPAPPACRPLGCGQSACAGSCGPSSRSVSPVMAGARAPFSTRAAVGRHGAAEPAAGAAGSRCRAVPPPLGLPPVSSRDSLVAVACPADLQDRPDVPHGDGHSAHGSAAASTTSGLLATAPAATVAEAALRVAVDVYPFTQAHTRRLQAVKEICGVGDLAPDVRAAATDGRAAYRTRAPAAGKAAPAPAVVPVGGARRQHFSRHADPAGARHPAACATGESLPRGGGEGAPPLPVLPGGGRVPLAAGHLPSSASQYQLTVEAAASSDSAAGVGAPARAPTGSLAKAIAPPGTDPKARPPATGFKRPPAAKVPHVSPAAGAPAKPPSAATASPSDPPPSPPLIPALTSPNALPPGELPATAPLAGAPSCSSACSVATNATTATAPAPQLVAGSAASYAVGCVSAGSYAVGCVSAGSDNGRAVPPPSTGTGASPCRWSIPPAPATPATRPSGGKLKAAEGDARGTPVTGTVRPFPTSPTTGHLRPGGASSAVSSATPPGGSPAAVGLCGASRRESHQPPEPRLPGAILSSSDDAAALETRCHRPPCEAGAHGVGGRPASPQPHEPPHHEPSRHNPPGHHEPPAAALPPLPPGRRSAAAEGAAAPAPGSVETVLFAHVGGGGRHALHVDRLDLVVFDPPPAAAAARPDGRGFKPSAWLPAALAGHGVPAGSLTVRAFP